MLDENRNHLFRVLFEESCCLWCVFSCHLPIANSRRAGGLSIRLDGSCTPRSREATLSRVRGTWCLRRRWALVSPTGRLRKTRTVQIFFSLSFFNVQFRASCYPNLLFCASTFTPCPPEIQFRQRALASLLAPESPPPACLHVGGAYQRFLFFFVPLDQAPHHVLITLLHFLHFYSSLPSLFVSHGEWRYCFSIFNLFSLFLFTINLKKLLSRKNYKYSLDNFVSYKKKF